MPTTAEPRPLPRLMVLSSTYPRWAGDTEPGFVHALCLRLAGHFEVHVICPHAPGALTEETLASVHIHRFRYAPGRLETLVQGGGILGNLRQSPWKWLLVPLFFIGLAIKTWRLERRLRPACIHAHWMVPQGLVLAGLGPWRRRAAPFLLTSHGSDLFGLRGPLFERLKRAVVRQAAAIAVVSRAMVADVIRLGAPPKSIHVLPMGVDFDVLFTPGPPEDRRPGEILFVGRLIELKGLRYLVEAMPAILARQPGARLRIAGGGPQEGELRAQAVRLGLDGAVSFLGALPQDQLPDLYRRANVFVAPFVASTSGAREGLGLVTVEAIACGCPVIVGDTPALDDLLEPDEADLRVDPRQVDALAERILSVIEEPHAAYARALGMRRRLATRLGWGPVADAYAGLLLGLGDSRQRQP